MRNISLILAAVMLLGLSGCGTASEVPELREPVEVTWQTATAFCGDISHLEAYNAFVAREMEEAAFETGGTLKAVYVRTGETVEKGRLLAELDTEALEESLQAVYKSMGQYELSYAYNLTQSQCTLEIARLQLQEVTGGKTPAALEAEKSAKAGAVTALETGITARETEIARLRETVAELEAAGQPEAGEGDAPEETPAVTPEATPEGSPEDGDALQQAKDALQAAEEALAAAKTELETEKAALALLEEKAAAAAALDLQIRQTENSIAYLESNYALQMARYGESAAEIQAQIDACSLYAENNGVVCTVTVNRPGAAVGTGPLVCIAVEGTEYICYAGGKDIARTSAKAQANVHGTVMDLTLIPYSNAEYSTMSRNGITPAARFSFDNGAAGADFGDYVQLLLYAGTREDVILLPLGAVYMGSAYSESHVYRIVDGEKVYTPVTVGIKNEIYVEIQSGIAEGDVVYVRD